MYIESGFNLRPFVFEELSHRNFFICSNVARNWFNFSSFIPGFLEKLSSFIEQDDVRSRILSIALEERGGGGSCSHSDLFQQAMNANGYLIEISPSTRSIIDFENSFDLLIEDNNKEAFSVGVAFGLEIIAEENIRYLLRNTSINDDEYEKNQNSLFFKIHLVNEKDHIEKCFENIRSISEANSISLTAGINLSLNFWKAFWKEAVDA